MSDLQMWAWASALSVLGTLAGVVVYSVINKSAWSLKAKLASAFAGAALGTFGGALVAIAISVEWLKVPVVLLSAILFSIGMQRTMFNSLKEQRA